MPPAEAEAETTDSACSWTSRDRNATSCSQHLQEFFDFFFWGCFLTVRQGEAVSTPAELRVRGGELCSVKKHSNEPAKSRPGHMPHASPAQAQPSSTGARRRRGALPGGREKNWLERHTGSSDETLKFPRPECGFVFHAPRRASEERPGRPRQNYRQRGVTLSSGKGGSDGHSATRVSCAAGSMPCGEPEAELAGASFIANLPDEGMPCPRAGC
jgi:hypothetical protein